LAEACELGEVGDKGAPEHIPYQDFDMVEDLKDPEDRFDN